MAANLTPADILSGTGLAGPQGSDSALVKLGILVTEPFEQFYGAVGARQPWQRFLLGFSLSSVLVWLTEPEFAFNPNGSPRPFSLLDSQSPDATIFHWSTIPFGIGLASAVFI